MESPTAGSKKNMSGPRSPLAYLFAAAVALFVGKAISTTLYPTIGIARIFSVDVMAYVAGGAIVGGFFFAALLYLHGNDRKDDPSLTSFGSFRALYVRLFGTRLISVRFVLIALATYCCGVLIAFLSWAGFNGLFFDTFIDAVVGVEHMRGIPVGWNALARAGGMIALHVPGVLIAQAIFHWTVLHGRIARPLTHQALLALGFALLSIAIWELTEVFYLAWDVGAFESGPVGPGRPGIWRLIREGYVLSYLSYDLALHTGTGSFSAGIAMHGYLVIPAWMLLHALSAGAFLAATTGADTRCRSGRTIAVFVGAMGVLVAMLSATVIGLASGIVFDVTELVLD